MTEAQKLPGAYEVVFYNETEDSPGMMLWRYPEPRVLTLVRINPVPFNTTEDPDISTADLGDVLQVGNETFLLLLTTENITAVKWMFSSSCLLKISTKQMSGAL